jgi:hypothetical protein
MKTHRLGLLVELVSVTALLCSFTAAAQVPLPELIKTVKAGVVTIETKDTRGNPLSQGSGFVIEGGRIVTNDHVIGGMASGVVITADGKPLEIVEVVLHNRVFDLAVLRVDAMKHTLHPLPLCDESPEVGAEVVVVGTPKGLSLSVSTGIVSAVRDQAGDGHLQFTAPVSPGSSGGPVLDRNGRVVAVVVGSVRGGQSLNLGAPTSALVTALELAEKAAKTGLMKPLSVEVFRKVDTAAQTDEAGIGDPFNREKWAVRATALEEILAERPYVTPLRIELTDLYARLAHSSRDRKLEHQQLSERLRQHIQQVHYWSDYIYSVDRRKTLESLREAALMVSVVTGGFPEEGVKLAALAVKLEPERGENYATLHSAYQATGQTGAAVAALEEGLKVDPDSTRLHYIAAIHSFSVKDMKRYHEHYQKLKALNDTEAIKLLDMFEKGYPERR